MLRTSRFGPAAVLLGLAACSDGPTTPRTTSDAAGADAVLESLTQAGSGAPYATATTVFGGLAGAPLVPAPVSSAACSYADGRYSCPPVMQRGVTVTRAFAFYDATGAPQRRYDSLATASVFNQVTVAGRPEGMPPSMVVEIARTFTQTASGLLGRETRRVVDGTGSDTTKTTMATPRGTHTSTTVTHDTTRALVLPVVERSPASSLAAPPPYPLGGSVTTVLSHTGSSSAPPEGFPWLPTTTRMTTTFDGTSVARIEISTGGFTRVCTLDMAARPSALSCPGGRELFGP